MDFIESMNIVMWAKNGSRIFPSDPQENRKGVIKNMPHKKSL